MPSARQSGSSGVPLHHLDLSTYVVVPEVAVPGRVVPGVVGVTVVIVVVPGVVVVVVEEDVFGQKSHSPGHTLL